MCGIAGVLSLGSPISDRDIGETATMTELLHHRGPNHRGVHHDELFALGSARLKIIDLSDDGNMPMCNEAGDVWLTYNGEVTNFRELIDQFDLADNHRFKSTSDAEVLIHLYEDLGIDFVRHLSGMFAFCLVDQRIGKAFVVRDFYGIRPLFFMRAGDRLYFASEIKSFLPLERFEDDINHEAIFHFLSLAYIPDRLTPFAKVDELPGASLLEVDLGTSRVAEREYYEVRYDPDPDVSEPEATRALRDGMIDAVRRNLISDAPLGMTLSGGFDTSSILSIVKHLGHSRGFHTFSLKIDEPSFDESHFQRLMADYAGSEHHEIVVRPDNVMDAFVRHMAYMDEPSGDGAAIPTWLLADAAKEHVSVLLSGEGGDEVFNAYETHVAYRVRELYRRWVPSVARRAVRGLARRLPVNNRKLSFDFLAKRFSEGAELDVPRSHFFWRHTISEELKRELMPEHSNFAATDHFFTDLYERLDFPDPLDRISLIDIKYFFIGDLMVKNDRMMMAHSIEARFPWMDRLLVERASRIPGALRIKGLKRRYLQKQAMKELVPPEIYRRSNMGLEMPHSLWFFEGFRPLADRYLTRANVERTGFLRFDAVDAMWREHMGRGADHGRALWCIVNLLAWFELFVDKKNFRDYLG